MFKTIFRYIAVNFITPFIVTASFLVMFMMTFQLFRIISLIISKNIETWVILRLVFDISVSFLPVCIPISTLFASIYTMNKLSEDSEVVAMRAMGMSKYKLFFPLFFVAIFIGMGLFSMSKNIIPNSTKTFKNELIKVSSQTLFNEIKSESFFTEIPNITLFAQTVENQGEFFKKIFLYNRGPKKATNPLDQVIFAESGNLIKKYDEFGMISSIRLNLKNGNIIRTQSGKTEKILFEYYDFPVFNQDEFVPQFIRKDNMMTNQELKKFIKDWKEQKKEDPEHRLVKAEIEYWSRYNYPIHVLVFALLGFTMGVKTSRVSVRNSGLITVSILLLYYILFFGLIGVAQKGKIDASIAVFLPTILIGILGMNYFRKLDWSS